MTSALTPSAATRRRQRQPKSVEIVESSPSPSAFKRTATTSDVADDLALSTSTSRPTSEAGSTDDMFVDITDEEAATEINLPTSRVPTRPLPVAAPHLRRVGRREAEDAVAVRPPATSVPTAKRRQLEMAPSVLAQQVIANPAKSSRDLVGNLSTRYSWTPTEQRDRVNVVRGMRAMAAAFSGRIRRRLPLNRTDEDNQRFLTVVEEECQLMEGHVSDEFTG